MTSRVRSAGTRILISVVPIQRSITVRVPQIQPMRWAALTASWRLAAASFVAALER